LIQQLVTAADARAWSHQQRLDGRRLVLVPTMGALHEGHLRLVDAAFEHGDRVVVSIFVNPIQFNRTDDFEHYPRTFEEDAAKCVERGVHALYVPRASDMYPSGFQTYVEPGPLAEPLCGAGRPGHFRGVTTVVSKLFHAVRPDVALFGQKDFQQLAIIRRMTCDLDFGIEIVGIPTVREEDGVALSSRNQLLTPDSRRAARCVPRALQAAAAGVAAGHQSATWIVRAAAQVIDAEPLAKLEYCELRDTETLELLDELDRPGLLAVAVWFGPVRLIDNVVLSPLPRPHAR
jgi:pantoate--beta-alanine ligase